MTRQQLSLLLYLEIRAVDHGGLVNLISMNKADLNQAKAWTHLGLIEFGRVASDDIKKSTHWVKLSQQAQMIVASERAARAQRGWKARTWQTTAERQEAS